MRHTLQELRSVNVRTQTTGRQNHRNTVSVQFLHQLLNKDRTLADDLLIHRLLQTDSDRLHRANLHTTVGQETLEQGDELLHLQDQLLVVGDDTATTSKT